MIKKPDFLICWTLGYLYLSIFVDEFLLHTYSDTTNKLVSLTVLFFYITIGILLYKKGE